MFGYQPLILFILYSYFSGLISFNQQTKRKNIARTKTENNQKTSVLKKKKRLKQISCSRFNVYIIFPRFLHWLSKKWNIPVKYDTRQMLVFSVVHCYLDIKLSVSVEYLIKMDKNSAMNNIKTKLRGGSKLISFVKN